MRSVCVIGGGTAGAEAAREAARDGACVTVIEKSPRPDLPWRDWPDQILRGTPSPEPALPKLGPAPKVALIGAEAEAVDGGSVLTSEGTLHFDAVIIATGSDFEPVLVRGCRKPGVHTLRSAEAYAHLGRCRSSISRAVVAGEGSRALQVADRLSGEGREVRAFVSSWRDTAPAPCVREVLEKAATERGVSMVFGRVSRAVGEGYLEAAVAEGAVLPSDALVLLPDRTPRVIPTDAELGVHGGLCVDRYLRTSSAVILAAGGCAEFHRRDSVPHIFDTEPVASGRIAGANSVGRNLPAGLTRSWDHAVFGLRWRGVVLEAQAMEHPSALLGSVNRRSGASACAIVFERSGGRVLRVESVEPAQSQHGASDLPSWASSLRSLAYDGSSDISLVSDTARLGLEIWSNS